MIPDLKQLTISLSGRVQGVFFRRGVKRIADKLKLAGQARNLGDGGLEVVVEGPGDKLQELLDWCYRGTRLAQVESLKFSWVSATGAFRDFSVVREGNFLKDKLLAFRNLSGSFLAKAVLPKHVAIIPDGNRRWAKLHKFEVFRGHSKGVDNVEKLMEESLRLKIPYLTLWGFSTENWQRPKTEIKFLMDLSRHYLERLRAKLINYKVQFRHFGRKDRLPKDILGNLARLELETRGFSQAHFGLAFDYGGRDEILRAIEKCKVENGKVTEENLTQALDTKSFPDPDLIIRTSGEQRLSGLMPWQGTYAELYFTPVLFPDFDVLEFRRAIADYSSRKRNFGS